MEKRDFIMREIEALGRMLSGIVAFLLGLKRGAIRTRGIEFVSRTLKSEVDLDLGTLLSIDPDNLIDYLTANSKGFDEENLDKLAGILFMIADDMDTDDPKRISYCQRCLAIYEYLDRVQRLYSLDRQARMEQIRALLKTPKSRLATETKAEFTFVNEHFVDGA